MLSSTSTLSEILFTFGTVPVLLKRVASQPIFKSLPPVPKKKLEKNWYDLMVIYCTP